MSAFAVKRKVFLVLTGAAALVLLSLASWRYGWESWHLHRLDSDRYEIRAVAAEKLAAMKSCRAVPRLLELVGDPPPRPLSYTIELNGVVERVTTPVLSRDYADRALRSMGAGAAPRLLECLGRPAVQLAAAKYLGALGGEAQPAVPAILAIFREDPEARRAASVALNHLGPAAAEGLGDLTAGLGDPDAQVRANCAQALGKIGRPARVALPALRPLLGDPDEEVRCAAGISLIALGEDMKRPLEVLLQLLEGASEPVRLRAAEGLKGIDR